MKLRADNKVIALTPNLSKTLHTLRQWRGFDAQQTLDAKVAVVAEYLRQHDLRGVVLGVSGGIDSAVAAGILDRVARMEDSALRRLELVCLPSLGDLSVSRQDQAVDLARLLGKSLGRPVNVVPMDQAITPLRALTSQALDITADTWAQGQAVSYLRTPFFYQLATLLTQQGCPALVAGTINRDEGAYLGYVGKAGDGMVDMQLLSDLHKSEVRQLAVLLQVPGEIQSAVPSADMFDACADTDIFGAPYDGVELRLLAATLATPEQWRALCLHWTPIDHACWQQVCANLDALHASNAHKYLVGSPAVHLDLLESAVPCGWHPARPEPHALASTVQSSRPAGRVLDGGDRRAWVDPTPRNPKPLDQERVIARIPGLLTAQGVGEIMRMLDSGPWQQSDVHGQWQAGTRAFVPACHTQGSWRTSFQDEALAVALWERIRHEVPAFRRRTDLSRFGAARGAAWRPIGINPVFRVLRYCPGETLVAHYDGPFAWSARRQSGMSLLLALESGQQGATRFLHDGQEGKRASECIFADWERVGMDSEVRERFECTPGDGYAFDHQMLHDSEPLLSGRKTIVRTDVIFECVGP